MSTRRAPNSKLKTFAFIDASNLFYGGEKSLGWKVDYRKLLKYLRTKYSVTQALYFGGVETHTFPYDYLKHETVPLGPLRKHVERFIAEQGKSLDDAALLLLSRHVQRIKFYQRLEEFGYQLFLKPVKLYDQQDGGTRRKANCDVDLAFHLMKEKDHFDRVVILSGDGDFLPVLKYLRQIGREVLILARGPRTAREIRQFAGAEFRDFVRLEKDVKFSK